MSGLLTLVPTRNRVENARGLLDTWFDTVVDPDSGILFIVGTEDPRYEEYLQDIPEQHLLTFPDRGLVKALNYAAPLYTSDYESIGFMGDDHRPRTFGWDQSYLESLRRMGGGFVYGNDLLVGERIPTQIAISSSIIEALGYFGPPCFTHLCVDLSWKDLGEAIGRIEYLPDVIIEHMHPAAGKAEVDAGYEFVNSNRMIKRDELAYKKWKKYSLRGDARHVARELGIVLE